MAKGKAGDFIDDDLVDDLVESEIPPEDSEGPKHIGRYTDAVAPVPRPGGPGATVGWMGPAGGGGDAGHSDAVPLLECIASELKRLNEILLFQFSMVVDGEEVRRMTREEMRGR